MIIPALLATDSGELREKFSSLPEEAGFVHLDVLEEDVWAETDKEFEAHLMVKKPEEILERWVERGAKRLIIHNPSDATDELRGEIEIGLGVEMHIPLEEVFGNASRADFLHLMSIAEIGEQGHPLDERIFDRIRKVKEELPTMPVSVDGGINVSNYLTLIESGADRLVVGSHFEEIWNSLKGK